MSKDRKKKSTRKKPSSLPAFDFGKDLLKGKPEDDGPEENPTAASASGAESADPSAVAAPPPAEAPPASRSLPEENPPTEEIVVNEPSDSAYESAPAKIELPAFGFAEDLLREYRAKQAAQAAAQAEQASADPPTAQEPAAQTSPVAPPPGAPMSPTEPGTTEIKAYAAVQATDAASEDRIFAFADSLDARAGREEKARPKRLETWLTLTLAGELFALPVKPVRQVLRLSSITRVPHAPNPIRGVTNVRGRVIPVIDLRLRLELPESALDRGSRIVVVQSRGRLLGLLVDGVQQVVHLDMDLVQPPPDDVMTVQSDYISGVYDWQDRLLLLIEVDRALILRSGGGQSAPQGRVA